MEQNGHKVQNIELNLRSVACFMWSQHHVYSGQRANVKVIIWEYNVTFSVEFGGKEWKKSGKTAPTYMLIVFV